MDVNLFIEFMNNDDDENQNESSICLYINGMNVNGEWSVLKNKNS